MSKKIESGDVVKIECVGKLLNGMVFTDSQVDGPIKFKVGEFDVIKGLNNAVIGMENGEEKTINIKPSDACGVYDDTLLTNMSIDKLPENAEQGMQLQSETEDGQEIIWTIKEIQGDSAVLDANHILAGQELEFQIKVVEVE